MGSRVRAGAPLLFASWVLAACQIVSPNPTTMMAGTVIVPPERMSLNANNFSTRLIGLFINKQLIIELPPNSTRSIQASDLPPLPWNAELRLVTGRTLLEMRVEAGSVRMGPGGGQSVANRADLSCGRIEMYSGYPMMGPPPGSGMPGDCDP